MISTFTFERFGSTVRNVHGDSFFDALDSPTLFQGSARLARNNPRPSSRANCVCSEVPYTCTIPRVSSIIHGYSRKIMLGCETHDLLTERSERKPGIADTGPIARGDYPSTLLEHMQLAQVRASLVFLPVVSLPCGLQARELRRFKAASRVMLWLFCDGPCVHHMHIFMHLLVRLTQRKQSAFAIPATPACRRRQEIDSGLRIGRVLDSSASWKRSTEK